MFDGEFKVESACLSNPTSATEGKIEFLALGGSDGLIEIWDYEKMTMQIEKLKFQKDGLFMVHQSPVLSLNFSSDNRLLTSGDKTGTIKVWKVADGKCLRQISIQLSQNLASVTTVRLNPLNSKVYACCLDKSIKVFGLKSGTMLKELANGHDTYI